MSGSFNFRIPCVQAIDRTYRIGQDKKVFAYRIFCKDTIEEIDSDFIKNQLFKKCLYQLH